MNKVRIPLLVSSFMMSVVTNAINIEPYITGNKVDAEGKTFLHKLAENCNNDDFQIELKPFDLVENKLSAEIPKVMLLMAILEKLPEEQTETFGTLFLLKQADEMFNAKDNNGNTALDIFRKQEKIKSCKRCSLGIYLLEEVNVGLKKSLQTTTHFRK